MAKFIQGRVVYGLVVAALSLTPVAGCGSADSEKDGDPSGGTPQQNGDAGDPGEGGSTERAGSSSGGAGPGTGGRQPSAGGAIGASAGRGSGGSGVIPSGGVAGFSVAGSPSVAGAPLGGNAGCLPGAPCKCGKRVGITECDEGEASCSCPPAEECALAEPEEPCFEPCGGEPFGSWILEDTCVATGHSESGDCSRTTAATPGESDLRLLILDGGELRLVGRESLSVTSQLSLGCSGATTVNACSVVYDAPGVLLFTEFPEIKCEPSACGRCDCSGELDQNIHSSFLSWSRAGTELDLGGVRMPYCVDGEEMWIGGPGEDGAPRVAYKFRKRSCTGSPVACEDREADECASDYCRLGRCVPTTGTTERCEQATFAEQCNVIQGCDWEPEGCARVLSDEVQACGFDNCAIEPGCSWGEPVARCGGYAHACAERDPSRCEGTGCSVTTCQPSFSDVMECTNLTAAQCAKASGCSVSGSGSAAQCTGQARCAAQTDAAVCAALNCSSGSYCEGMPTECSTLSVGECHSVPGCRIEW